MIDFRGQNAARLSITSSHLGISHHAYSKTEKEKTKAIKQTTKAVKKASKADAKARGKAPAKKIQTNEKKADDENAETEKKDETTNHTFGFSTPPRSSTSFFYDIIPSVAVLKEKSTKR